MINILFVESASKIEDTSTIRYQFQQGSIIPVAGMVYQNAYIVDLVLIYPNFDALLNKDSVDVRNLFNIIKESLKVDHGFAIEYVDVICYVHSHTRAL